MGSLIALLLTAIVSFGQEKSAFEQSLEADTSTSSHESWVEIKGVRYRKIEMNGGTYYLHFLQPDAKNADLYCQPPPGFQNEHLVVSEVQVYKRTRAFVQALRSRCVELHGNTMTKVDLDPGVGLVFPDGKDASLTNRRVILTPTSPTQVKVRGDF